MPEYTKGLNSPICHLSVFRPTKNIADVWFKLPSTSTQPPKSLNGTLQNLILQTCRIVNIKYLTL